jgi:ATP-binding cassette subfamily B protein
MARSTNDLQAVRMIVGPAIMYGSNTVFAATGALLLMLRIHVGLTLLALATLPFIAVVTRFFGRRIHIFFERVQEDFSGLSTRVQESLAGARVVRAYVREAAEERAFERASRRYVEANRRLIHWNAAFHPLLQGVIGFGFVAVLWYGGRLMIAELLTVGEFVTFTLFLAKLAWPMIAVGWVINLVERGTASLGRIRRLLDRAPRIADDAATDPELAERPIRGEVAFRHLSFAYGDGRSFG